MRLLTIWSLSWRKPKLFNLFSHCHCAILKYCVLNNKENGLHFPAYICWCFLSQRFQALIHHPARHYSALLHTSKWVCFISLVTKATVQCMTFGFHIHFDVTCLFSTSVLSSGRFSQSSKCFVRRPWFTDLMYCDLPSVDNANLLNFEQFSQILTSTLFSNRNFCLRCALFLHLNSQLCVK